MIIKLLLIFLNIYIVKSTLYDYEALNLSWTVGPNNDAVDLSDVRLERIKRTQVISGDFKIYKDLDDSYDIQCDLQHSSKGNNQYVQSPYKVDKMDFCSFMDKYYVKYAQDTIKPPKSNFPQYADSFECPFPKGIYTLSNYTYDNAKAPNIMPKGTYIAQCKFTKMDEMLLSSYYKFRILQLL